MKNYIKLMRVKHYIKNFLIFLPLFFNGTFFSNSIIKAIIGFFAFCLLSSCIYINNDINDIDVDRKHPIKKNRPLASGKVSIKQAKTLMIIISTIMIILQIIGMKYFNFNKYSPLYLLIYLVINVAYSYNLKNIPVIDLIILASGFVIRVLYGGIICNIPISNWLFLTVLSMAFYLGLGKRRNELKKNDAKSRKSLGKYNMEFLDKNMYMFLAMTLVFYCLWTVGTFGFVEQNPMIYTSMVVFFIVMKYSLVIEGNSFGDPVEVLLHDKELIIGVLIYIIMVGVMIYVI